MSTEPQPHSEVSPFNEALKDKGKERKHPKDPNPSSTLLLSSFPPSLQNPPTSSSPPSTATPDEVKAAGIIQKHVRGHQTRTANRESGLCVLISECSSPSELTPSLLELIILLHSLVDQVFGWTLGRRYESK